MNEYIIWDKEKKKFSSDAWFNLHPNGDLVKLSSNQFRNCNQNHSIHNYIGKTDIEGNKIYADCSIVEFSMSGSRKNFKATGYFYFNTKKLSYEFKYLMLDKKKSDKARTDIDWRNAYKDTFKIIGTLQENKDML